jgi:hypothetical protein
VAARQISLQAVGACGTPAATVAATTAALATSAGTVYMNQIGQGSNTTVTATCVATPVNPTWNVKVQVDFRPVIGFLRAGMHASTKTAGDVEFSQSLYVAGN